MKKIKSVSFQFVNNCSNQYGTYDLNEKCSYMIVVLVDSNEILYLELFTLSIY